jgi:YD repeat-containing protein
MITRITSPDNARTWDYTYDELGRLTGADRGSGTTEDRSFAYDDADNMVWNSGLCDGFAADNPNILYPDGNGADPGQALSTGHPHGPKKICGKNVTYDANGNALSYDVDGDAGLSPARSFLYDGENRPLASLRPGPR